MDRTPQLVASHFGVKGDVLQLGGVAATELVERYGSPLYVYAPAVFRSKLERLRRALPDFEVHYAVKANPTPAVLDFFVQEGCDLDVATCGELSLSIAVGCPPSRIMLAGAGKTQDELLAAARAEIAEIHVESVDEIERLAKLAPELGRRIAVGLRLNPGRVDYGEEESIEAKPAGYGFDEEMLEEATRAVLAADGLELTGLHVYFGTQHLDVDLMVAAWGHVLALAERLCALADEPLRTIDFGGGLGVPYYKNESEFDVEEFGRRLAPLVARARRVPGLADANLVTEPGRYLTAEGGVYLTRVIARKHSRGQEFVVVDGGINHHLAATGNLGHVLKRNFPLALANRMGAEPSLQAEVVGRQSTALDTLARKAKLPAPEVGDIVAFFQSGAYARSSSPLQFRSQEEPAEVFAENGQARLVRKRSGETDLLRGTILDPSF